VADVSGIFLTFLSKFDLKSCSDITVMDLSLVAGVTTQIGVAF